MFLSLCGFLLQSWQETDKAAYLLRQYFFNNLHDRLSTRPFLSLVEKKWLAFQVCVRVCALCSLSGWLSILITIFILLVLQLLLALKQCHEKGICHGGFNTLMVRYCAESSWAIHFFFWIFFPLCRWYQVWECACHFLELALPCWFCFLQANIYSIWWPFWFLIFLWYWRQKAVLSCSWGW